MSFETSVEQWRDGERRLAEAPPFQQDALERVTARIAAELRRRLGGAFTADELAELYEQEGTGWCVDLAVATAPEQPYAWDARDRRRRRLRPLPARRGRLRRRPPPRI